MTPGAPATSSLSSTQTQLTLPGTDHQQRTGYYPWDTPRPATDMALTKSMELVKHIWREGIMVNATHDEELSLDAQSIIKDLIFQLSQKWNEVTHLQRRTEDLQRESLLRKWEDVGELELRPPKWRERQLEEVVPSPSTRFQVAHPPTSESKLPRWGPTILLGSDPFDTEPQWCPLGCHSGLLQHEEGKEPS